MLYHQLLSLVTTFINIIISLDQLLFTLNYIIFVNILYTYKMDRRNSPAGGKVAAGRKATAKGKASNSLLVLSNDRLTKLPEELFRMVVENLHYGDKKRLKLACKSLRWKVGTIGRPTDVEGLLWRIYVMKHHEDYRYRDRPHRKRALADVSPGSCNDELKAIDKTLLHYYQNVEKDLNKLGHSPGLSWTFPADVKKIYSGRRRTRREDTPDTTDPDNDELGQHLTEPLMHTYGSTKPGRPYSTLAYHMIDAMRQHCEDATHSDYKWLHFPSTIPKQRLNIWGRMLARLEGRLARMVEYEVHVHKADQLVAHYSTLLG